MNDFDTWLERGLAEILDPIVRAPIPLRRRTNVRRFGLVGPEVTGGGGLATVSMAMTPEVPTKDL